MKNIAIARAAVDNLCEAAIAYVRSEEALDGTYLCSELDDLRELSIIASADLDQACHLFVKALDSAALDHFERISVHIKAYQRE